MWIDNECIRGGYLSHADDGNAVPKVPHAAWTDIKGDGQAARLALDPATRMEHDEICISEPVVKLVRMIVGVSKKR